MVTSPPLHGRRSIRVVSATSGHGDRNSAELLNAFGQCVNKLSLFVTVLVEEKTELVERGTGDLPMVLTRAGRRASA
jgi:hypothetical protein